MKKKSKAEKVRDYLISGKPLSKLECFKMFSYWNLSDLIYKMREGKYDDIHYDIKTTMQKTTTNSEYAEYQIVKFTCLCPDSRPMPCASKSIECVDCNYSK